MTSIEAARDSGIGLHGTVRRASGRSDHAQAKAARFNRLRCPLARARGDADGSARPARAAQRPLAARFDGEVAGGAESTLVIFRFGATMELGRSGRSMMMMMMTSASASGGDGGVAGPLSEVQRPTGSSTAIAKFCSTDGIQRS
jgi:hypothetical protein